MYDLTPIVNAVISLVALLITAFVIPYIRAKISAEKLAEVQKWANIAVRAAEMVYKDSGLGRKKKEVVTEFLKSKGYSLDVNTIDALIESAVHDMKLLDSVPSETPIIFEDSEEGDDIVI